MTGVLSKKPLWRLWRLGLIAAGFSSLLFSYTSLGLLNEQRYWMQEDQQELERLDRRWQTVYAALTQENKRRIEAGEPPLGDSPPPLVNARAEFDAKAALREAALAKPERIARLFWLSGLLLALAGVGLQIASERRATSRTGD